MRSWTYLLLLLIVTACTVQKRVCPTYQSAFIFDKNTKENHFNYYNNNSKAAMTVTASAGKSIEIPQKDSLWVLHSLGLDGPAVPFHRKVRRDKHLLLPKKSYRKTLKLMRTVERKFVKEAYDSAKMAEMHRLDSLSLRDSTYRISVAREKFNLDQDIYMWYFKDQLLLPDARWEKYDKKAEEERLAKETAKKNKKNRKGWFSFLKRKKKVKDTVYVKTELPPDATIEQKTKAIEKEDYNEDEKYNIEDELIDSTAVDKPEKDTVKNVSVEKVKEETAVDAPVDNSKLSAKELKKKEKEEAKKKAGQEKAAKKKAKEDEKKARYKAKEEAQQGAEIDESLLREKNKPKVEEEADPQAEDK